VQQPDGYGAGFRSRRRKRGSLVVAVIDEQHFAAHPGQHRAQPGQQRGDIADFVAGRHQHAHHRCRRQWRAITSTLDVRQVTGLVQCWHDDRHTRPGHSLADLNSHGSPHRI
jgi:hypothetical protein